METKNNRKTSRSFYVPLLLVLLAVAGVVAVTTSFRDAAEDAAKDRKTDIPVVAEAPVTVENKDGEGGDKAETEKPAWMKEAQSDETGDETAPVETEAEAPAEPEEPAVPTFIAPVSGVITKGFSADVPVFSDTMRDYRTHAGVDVSAEVGEAVLAAADGMVGAIWDDPMMGKCMTIVHDGGFASTYKGLHEIIPEGVAQGVAVKAGQPIGAVGETALVEVAEEPHIHFELTRDGAPVDPCAHVTFSAAENYGK